VVSSRVSHAFCVNAIDFLGLFPAADYTAGNTLIVIVISIGAFVLSAQLTFSSASLASKRDDDAMYNWYVAFLVANAFLLITVEFATLYWVIGTRPNFNPELSRWDAIYFRTGDTDHGRYRDHSSHQRPCQGACQWPDGRGPAVCRWCADDRRREMEQGIELGVPISVSRKNGPL
jgi:hypothetical protein